MTLRSLVLLLVVFALPVAAEQKYYTWVDAQGNVRSTLITSDSEQPATNKETPSNKQENAKQENANPEDSSPDFDPNDFPSEEDYQQSLKDKPDGEKPFYTWTDAEGIIRSDVKPDVMIEFSAAEVVYDAAFAPPFRLPKFVTEGVCCESYADHFTARVMPLGSASFKVDPANQPFKTQAGFVDAAYFSLPELNERELLLVKAYKVAADTEFELIALSENFKPIYLADGVEGASIKETWKNLAFKKVMVEVSDPEIKHLIVFLKDALGQAKTNYTVSLIRDTL